MSFLVHCFILIIENPIWEIKRDTSDPEALTLRICRKPLNIEIEHEAIFQTFI